MTPADYVVHIFGGTAKLAELLKIARPTVSHWVNGQAGGRKGRVPSKYHEELLARAKVERVELTPHHLIYGAKVPGMRVLVPKV